MSDDIDREEGSDRSLDDIEALLRELDVEDLELADPPPEVWAGIERAVASDAAPVVSIQRRRRAPWLAAAAAAVLVVLVGALVAGRLDEDDEGDIVATAVLVHDPATFDRRGADAAATARLIEQDGHYEIALDDADLPALTDDDLELWLIQPDAEGNPVDIAPVAMIAADEPGTYEVPDGLDPATHFVVDISIEPRDGDTTHSGQSILRAPFETA